MGAAELNIILREKDLETARAWNGLAIGTRRAENLVSFKRLLDLDQRKEIGMFDYD